MTEDQLALYTVAGSYLPSFFKMKVFTDESFLDIQKLTPQAASVFFHEYLHFIQDVGTFHGLSNIIRIGEYLHSCKEIIKNGEEIFLAPIPPNRFNSGVLDTTKITRVLNGQVDNVFHKVEIDDIVVVESGAKNMEGENVPEVIITYNGGTKYRFGALAIAESMAYIGERHFFPSSPPAPTFPYDSAELLVHKIYQEFGLNKLNIFALCDLALLTGEPGPSFIRYLYRMRDSKFLPKSPHEIYRFFENERFWFGLHRLSRIQMLSSLGQMARHYLRGYFPGGVFDDNIEWMNYIIDHAIGLRNRSMSFPLDILLEGSFYNNRELDLSMKNIGGPLLLNANNEAFFIIIEQLAERPIQPDLNWVTMEILRNLISTDSTCRMKSYCKKSAEKTGVADFTNPMCDTNPWERANRNLDCSFTRVLKMWQIDQKILRRN